MKSTKTMLIAALIAGALLACNSALLAQNSTNNPPAGGMRGGRGGPTIEQLTTNLSLTADQIPKVKAVLDGQRQKMTDLRADTSLSQEDRRTQMQAIRADVMAQMKDILTPDQFTKYQTLTQRNRRPAGGGNSGGGGGGNGAPPAGTPPQT
jgi:Spy/CpxP family protein refolding chaperone